MLPSGLRPGALGIPGLRQAGWRTPSTRPNNDLFQHPSRARGWSHPGTDHPCPTWLTEKSSSAGQAAMLLPDQAEATTGGEHKQMWGGVCSNNNAGPYGPPCWREGLPAGSRRSPGLWSSWRAASSSCAMVWTRGSSPPAQRSGRSSAASAVDGEEKTGGA